MLLRGRLNVSAPSAPEQYDVRDVAGPIELVDLGYTDAALDSWEQFRARAHLNFEVVFSR